MTPNYWVSLILFLAVVSAMIYGVIKMTKSPENEGKEPGRVLLRIGITYTLTILILIQIFLNIVEAGIVGSLQDPGINTGARMGGHFLIAAGGILGALTWIKSFREMIMAPYMKEPDGKDAHWGKRFAYFMVCLVLMLMGVFFSIAAPVANMWVLANAVHNTRELSIFLSFANYKFGGGSLINYQMALVENGASSSYSPWGGLAGVMVFSVVVTCAHMFICIWEVVFALKLSITKSDMSAAFETDMNADKKPKDPNDKGKGKGKGKKDEDEDNEDEDDEDEEAGKGKSKGKKKADHAILDKLWSFMGMSDDDAEKWTRNVFPLLDEKDKAGVQDAAIFASKMNEVVRKVQAFEKTGKGPKKETAEEIAEELKDLIKKRSKGKLTLPQRKNG